jgi:hypothetical protein
VDLRSDLPGLFIAIPSLSGTTTGGLMEFVSTLQVMSLTGKLPFTVQFQVQAGTSPVEYARNRLVRTFLEHTRAEYLWFIDDDMVPTPSSLAMLFVDADLVAGRAFAWQHRPGGVPRYFISAFRASTRTPVEFSTVTAAGPDDLIQEIDAAGAACLLIRRRVLEDRRMWLPTAYTTPEGDAHDLAGECGDEEWAPPVFQCWRKPSGQVYRGEDIDFVWRARQLGYVARVHLGAVFGHVKPIDLEQVGQLWARQIEDRLEHAPARGAAAG